MGICDLSITSHRHKFRLYQSSPNDRSILIKVECPVKSQRKILVCNFRVGVCVRLDYQVRISVVFNIYFLYFLPKVDIEKD